MMSVIYGLNFCSVEDRARGEVRDDWARERLGGKDRVTVRLVGKETASGKEGMGESAG